MKELNKKSLEEALGQLPRYEPKKSVWEDLAQHLEVEESEQPLREAIRHLPYYEPPMAVWQQIEATLQPKKTIRRHLSVRNGWAAAASVCLLLAVAWWLWPQDDTRIDIVRSTEITPEAAFVNDWDSDEEAFAMITNLCEVQSFTCQQPEFKDLKAELEELDAAKAEVKAAIELYGQDARFVSQLVRIEQERSDVLKQLVKMI